MATLDNAIDALLKQAQSEDPFVAEVRAGKRSEKDVVVPGPGAEDSEYSEYLRLREEFDRAARNNLSLQQYASF